MRLLPSQAPVARHNVLAGQVPCELPSPAAPFTLHPNDENNALYKYKNIVDDA